MDVSLLLNPFFVTAGKGAPVSTDGGAIKCAATITGFVDGAFGKVLYPLFTTVVIILVENRHLIHMRKHNAIAIIYCENRAYKLA